MALGDEEADLLGLQHQVLVQLDDPAKQDERVVFELVQLGRLPGSLDIGDGDFMAAQSQQLGVHGRRDFTLYVQPKPAVCTGVPQLQQCLVALAHLAVAAHQLCSNRHTDCLPRCEVRAGRSARTPPNDSTGVGPFGTAKICGEPGTAAIPPGHSRTIALPESRHWPVWAISLETLWRQPRMGCAVSLSAPSRAARCPVHPLR